MRLAFLRLGLLPIMVTLHCQTAVVAQNFTVGTLDSGGNPLTLQSVTDHLLNSDYAIDVTDPNIRQLNITGESTSNDIPQLVTLQPNTTAGVQTPILARKRGFGYLGTCDIPRIMAVLHSTEEIPIEKSASVTIRELPILTTDCSALCHA